MFLIRSNWEALKKDVRIEIQKYEIVAFDFPNMTLDTGQKSSYKDQVSENRNAVKIRPGVVSRRNHWLQVKFGQILSKI